MYALINVNMATFAAYFYVLFEVEISFEKYSKSYEDEEHMSYSLMDYYDYRRNLSTKFIHQHIGWLIYSFYSGFVIFFMYWLSLQDYGVLGLDGQNQDLYSFGVLVIMTFVVQHHFIVGINVRHWSIPYILLFIFACA